MKARETPYKKPLSVGQVAGICKVSNKTVLNWIYSGGLKAFTTYGGHYRLWPSNVSKFLHDTRMDIPFEVTHDDTRHVVIISCDMLFSRALRDALTASVPGIDVVATNDGYEGMILIGEIQPELVILDTRMSGIEGMRLLNVLKKRNADRDVKIIAIAPQMDPDAHTAVPAAHGVFFEKNPDMGAVLRKVAAFLHIDATTGARETLNQHSQ